MSILDIAVTRDDGDVKPRPRPELLQRDAHYQRYNAGTANAFGITSDKANALNLPAHRLRRA